MRSFSHKKRERHCWPGIGKFVGSLSSVSCNLTPYTLQAHVTDLFDMFGPSDMTDHLIHFVNYLDPNGPTRYDVGVPEAQAALRPGYTVAWPKYEIPLKAKLAYLDGPIPQVIIRDTDREEQVQFMADFWKKYWVK